MSPKWAYEARRRIERKRDVWPRRRLGQMMRPLTIGSWQKARGRVCNAGEVCARKLSFFQVALGRAPPGVYTQCVCEVTVLIESLVLGVQDARLSWTSINRVLFFLSSSLSDEQCSNLSFENPNLNPKNCSHRDTAGICGVYCGRWRCMDTYHSRNSAFLPSNCGLFFF